jgi:SAM-dependent methyltransferase
LTSAARCRACGTPLEETFVDLGMSPLANAFLTTEQCRRMEPFYPLHVFVCSSCLLVQLEEFESPERIFGDYFYFSSFSPSWLDHAARYVAAMTERLGLGPGSKVVEIASNDGYLLQYFVARGIPVLGVEPAANVAAAAVAKGVPTEVAFFGRATAERLARARRADLITANNVLAHVPDINDFVAGLAVLLAPGGTITVEFPHLLRLIAENQFDTIYHEHFSYLSLVAVERIFRAHGLALLDVETLPTHGGSLRIFAGHAGAVPPPAAGLLRVRAAEAEAGLDRLDTYRRVAPAALRLKCDVLEFFTRAARDGRRVVGYGAAAKGNTLLNYCGIGPGLMDYVVDRSPKKQGHHLPGTHLPVRAPAAILETRPDYLFILPWNLKDEIVAQMGAIP